MLLQMELTHVTNSSMVQGVKVDLVLWDLWSHFKFNERLIVVLETHDLAGVHLEVESVDGKTYVRGEL